MPTNGFKQHCRDIARRFLLTAVVVDDELSVTGDPPVQDHSARSGRGGSRRRETLATELRTPSTTTTPCCPHYLVFCPTRYGLRRRITPWRAS